MLKNLLKFARQGIWPSLSGGWYFDSSYSNFTNVFHLYTWIFFLSFPFTLYLVTQISWTVIGSYCGIIIIFFGTIKYISNDLHDTFDKGEQLHKKVSINNDTDLNRVIENEQNSLKNDEEVVDLNKSDQIKPNEDNKYNDHVDLWNEAAQGFYLENSQSINPLTSDKEVIKKGEMAKAEVYEHFKLNPAKNTIRTSSEELSKISKGTVLRKQVNRVAVGRCHSLPNNDFLLEDINKEVLSGSDSLSENNEFKSFSYFTQGDKNSKSGKKILQSDGKLYSSVHRCYSDNTLTSEKITKKTSQRKKVQRTRKPAIRIKRNILEDDQSKPKPQKQTNKDEGSILTTSTASSTSNISEFINMKAGNNNVFAAGDSNKQVIKPNFKVKPNKRQKKLCSLSSQETKENSCFTESPGEVRKKNSKILWLSDSETTSTDDDEEMEKFLESLRHSRIKNKDHKNRKNASTKEFNEKHNESSSDSNSSAAKKTGQHSSRNIKQKPSAPPRHRSLSIQTSQHSRLRNECRVRRAHSFRIRQAWDSRSMGNDGEATGRHRHPAGGTSQGDFTQDTGLNTHKISDDIINKSTGEQTSVHLATTHTDTSHGAVHTFQDENGKWMTYTFGSEAAPVALEVSTSRVSQTFPSHSRHLSVASSFSSPAMRCGNEQDPNFSTFTQSAQTERMLDFLSATVSRRPRVRYSGHNQLLMDAFHRSIYTGQRIPNGDTSPSSIISQLDIVRRSSTPKVKFLYQWAILPFKSFTIQYDRLALTDLLDRNVHVLEALLSIFLAVAVGILGLWILSQNLYFDLWSFWFCIVMATAQFSLIRSVQPDSASPTHGHNRIVAYSRPVYFILTGLLLMLFHYLADPNNIQLNGFPLYKFTLFNNASCAVARDFFAIFILILPFVFLFGLLPQLNTFFMYVCEQTEIHLFGGTALLSIGASIFCVARSLLALLLIYGFAYGAMLTTEGSQHILFSVFCGLMISISYHLSRQSSSLEVIWRIIKNKLVVHRDGNVDKKEKNDPAKQADCVSSTYMINAMKNRLQSDVVLCPVIAIFSFAIHSSTAFTSLQPTISTVLYIIVGGLGFVVHYLLPQLRKNMPWLLFAHPILKSNEYDLFEVTTAAKTMWFEKMKVILTCFEQNYLYPVLIMNELTRESSLIVNTYGNIFGCVIIVIVGLKLMRSAYCSPNKQYILFSITVLFVKYDAQLYQPSILITYFIFGILFVKIQELTLKLQFWLVYVAPWQITWGSAFHAFAQPFAVPHSAFLAAQALLAALVQAPFSPFLGSALFLSSYARPLKFWERNYKTNRIDHSNTRLSTQIDRAPHSVDNNLNSIFYEHLTYSLQKSLAGDLALGRWGNVCSGDCFILASDFLNALVHIVEKGNGLVSFQLRGLEFSGTYCQQREVEAINESPDLNEAFCCCYARKIPGMLSFNSAFNQRWLAWQVMVSNYVLDGYSISDNNATTMLGVFDLRKILTSYIVKGIIYFLVAHDSLDSWLENQTIRDAVSPCEASDYVDIDATFVVAIDDDYDTWLFGVSRAKFFSVYGPWLRFCCAQKEKKTNESIDCGKNSKLVTLAFAISVLGRRALGTASRNPSSNLDSFMYGLHSLFKGEFYITSPKDEWVFSDINLLEKVVAPGVRTALKLHQDHFLCPDEYDEHAALFEAIHEYTTTMVITHEGDPIWRKAVLSNASSLLALRRVVSDTFDDLYSIITLNHRSLGFNVVKINRECVRGLWAGQQNELVFLRNKNPERGSIQNAKQVLRNMINSSCDQPIGYPIYVSPLTTSYSSTNKPLTNILGGPITFKMVRNFFINIVACLSQSCSESCNSGGGINFHGNPAPPSIPMSIRRPASTTSSSLNRSSQQQRPRAPSNKSEHTFTNVTSQDSGTIGSGEIVSRRSNYKQHNITAPEDLKIDITPRNILNSANSSEHGSSKRSSMTTRL